MNQLKFEEVLKKEKKEKLVILSYGDNPKVSTGYGQVWDNLLNRWCKMRPNWDFYHLGWQNRDRKHKRAEGYTMLPMAKTEFGFDTVFKNLMSIKPDYLVTLCDVGWQSGFVDGVEKARQAGWRGKWVAYTPIDTHSWAMTWSQIFEHPDVNVAMAKWGYDKMKERGVPNLIRLDHGVDLETFHPLMNKQMLKDQYTKGKFVVGFCGRNQKRKRIDTLIKGFAKFSENKDDVLLMLHTDREPPKDGWSLPYMQWMYKLDGKLHLSKTDLDIEKRQDVSPNDINEIYNLMDVFCYATGGEGFGLPGIESQAAGIPIMMTEWTTGIELTEGHGFRIPVLKDKYDRNVVDQGTNGVEFVCPDDLEIARILEELYLDWKNGGKLLTEEGKKSREFALAYNWDKISADWIKMFEEKNDE